MYSTYKLKEEFFGETTTSNFSFSAFKKDDNGNYLYGVFCRAGKTERWQGIAGGVEEGETYLEACKREANEEASISYNANVIELKSISTTPVGAED